MIQGEKAVIRSKHCKLSSIGFIFHSFYLLKFVWFRNLYLFVADTFRGYNGFDSCGDVLLDTSVEKESKPQRHFVVFRAKKCENNSKDCRQTKIQRNINKHTQTFARTDRVCVVVQLERFEINEHKEYHHASKCENKIQKEFSLKFRMPWRRTVRFCNRAHAKPISIEFVLCTVFLSNFQQQTPRCFNSNETD